MLLHVDGRPIDRTCFGGRYNFSTSTHQGLLPSKCFANYPLFSMPAVLLKHTHMPKVNCLDGCGTRPGVKKGILQVMKSVIGLRALATEYVSIAYTRSDLLTL